MSNTINLVIYVISLFFSIFLGSIGVVLIETSAWGWVLLVLGTVYPCFSIIYIHRRRQNFNRLINHIDQTK